MNLQELQERGFDECEDNGDGTYKVRCSCCAALVIQGVPCHESGCPNQMHECAECETLVPKGHRLCESCANPDWDYAGPSYDVRDDDSDYFDPHVESMYNMGEL